MAPVDTTTFLAELEALTHAARQRRMVDLGRASLADASARSLLDTLSASEDAYARSLRSCRRSRRTRTRRPT